MLLRGWPMLRPLLAPDDEMSSAGWRPVGPDSVMAVWSDGFVGVRLHLRVDGDTLRGLAETFTDVVIVEGPPHPQAHVVARRIPCPGVADRSATRFLTSLNSLGDRIVFASNQAPAWVLPRGTEPKPASNARGKGGLSTCVELSTSHNTLG